MSKPKYRIHLLLHLNQELDQGAEDDFVALDCNDYDHPGYPEARALDDDRCGRCQRPQAPPRLMLIQGGRS